MKPMSPAEARLTLERLLHAVDLGGVAQVAQEVADLAQADRISINAAWVSASSKAVHAWITNWSILASGSKPAAEFKAKAITYADLLSARFPMGAFTATTCEGAAARFPEFPAYGELCAFLEDALTLIRERDRKLGLIVGAKPAQKDEAPRWCDMPAAEQAKIDGYFDQIYANLGFPRRRA